VLSGVSSLRSCRSASIHFPQLQMQQAQWIPLAVWAFHRVLWTGRIRDGVWLGTSLAAQLMSCMYYGIFLALYLVVVRHVPAGLAHQAVAPLVSGIGDCSADRNDPVRTGGERLPRRAEDRRRARPTGEHRLQRDADQLSGGARCQLDLRPDLRNVLAAMNVICFLAWSSSSSPRWRCGQPLSAVRASPTRLLWFFAVDLTLGFNGISYALMYELFSPSSRAADPGPRRDPGWLFAGGAGRIWRGTDS
jgi:hypothetical protein